MPLTVKLKREGGFFGFSVEPDDAGQPVLGEPGEQWADGANYVGCRVLRLNGIETQNMQDVAVAKAEIKRGDLATLVIDDKPGVAGLNNCIAVVAYAVRRQHNIFNNISKGKHTLFDKARAQYKDGYVGEIRLRNCGMIDFDAMQVHRVEAYISSDTDSSSGSC